MAKKIQSRTAAPKRKSKKKVSLESRLFGESGAQGFASSFFSTFSLNRIQTVVGLLLLLFALLSTVSVLSFLPTGAQDQSLLLKLDSGVPLEGQEKFLNHFGALGARWANFIFNGMFGWGSMCMLVFLFWIGILMVRGERSGYIPALLRFVKYAFFMIWVSLAMAALQSLFSVDSHLEWGGAHGIRLYNYLMMQVKGGGLLLILLASLVIGLVLTNDRALDLVQHPRLPRQAHIPRLGLWGRIRGFGAGEVEALEQEPSEEDLDEETNEGDALMAEDEPLEDEEPESEEEGELPTSESSQQPLSSTIHSIDGLIIEQAPEDDLVEVRHRNPGLAPGVMLEHYQIPSIELLKDYELNAPVQNMAEIERNKQRIIDTLASFKMRVTPSRITIGPAVTLYEVIPDQGIKVSRIKTMEEDIALSLKSEGIRIIAPMPGKGTIGIEVPNSTPQIVSMRSILASRRYNELRDSMELPIGMGKTITNEPFVFDLSRIPHLLIAGATGQGKSVGLNAIITSLLYSKRPEELKFVMVDPKMLEFSVYEELENHFLAKLPDVDKAIITDMTKVVPTLNSLCIEMDNRYHQLTQARVRGIKEYNQQVRNRENVAINGGQLMPYIVLVVDEFADLIMTSGKEVEQPITRLAQKARAAGIHMIIATQRPSTDVITGLIKANFPARIAFKVFSMIDSRTILDSPGANQLIGRGDMLFYQGKEMIRLQCAFLDTPESEAIVSHIQQQESTGSAYMLPEYIPEDEEGGAKTFNPSEKDPLFEEVARMVVNSQIGSTSNIQRKFNIGYNRAGRLMDQLEGSGVVGPQGGSKPREVLIKDMMSLERLFETLR